MRKVKISFQQYREWDLLAKGREIQKGITGNANFPTPTVPVATVDATLDDYEEALNNSATGDKNAIAHKNALQAIVIGMLRSNGSYVNSVAEGNLEKLVSSGYTVTKERQPSKVETPVIEKVLQGGNMGEMTVKVKAQKAAKSLEFQTAKDPIGEKTLWVSVTSSRSTFTFTNLEQGQKYWFRVVAIGANNQRLYSEPVSQYVMQYGVANAA